MPSSAHFCCEAIQSSCLKGILNIQVPASINLTASSTSHGKVSLHIQLCTARPGGKGHHFISEYWSIWLAKDGSGGKRFMLNIQAAREISGCTMSAITFNQIYDKTLYYWQLYTPTVKIGLTCIKYFLTQFNTGYKNQKIF